MRRFEVYIDHGVAGMDPITEILEFPNNATEAQIEADCAACLETMISNELDSGWNEIEAKPQCR